LFSVPSADWSFYSLLHVQAANEEIAPSPRESVNAEGTLVPQFSQRVGSHDQPGSYLVVSMMPRLLTFALEESGTSGSDYSEARQVKAAERRRKTERGRKASDTESEDARVDRELSGDAVTEDDNSAVRSPTNKSTHAPQDTDDGDEEANDAPEDRWTKSPGPLSKAAKAEAQAFAARVTAEAEQIARKHKKSTRDIMLAAGLGIRASRSKNPFNMFKKWYAHHHPNDGRKLFVLTPCLQLIP
jgi:hypothetical protein